MGKYFKTYIPTISVLFYFLPSSIFAATYVPLEPNAFSGISTSGNNLGGFLGQVFNWAIAIAVVAALVMIIWGGIEYMTTDSWSGKDDGKTKVKNALTGLGLALVSWLILYTINPNLVTFGGNKLINPSSQSNSASESGSNTGNTNLSGGIGPFNEPSGNMTTSNVSGANTSGGSVTESCPTCVNISGIAVKSGAGNELDSGLLSKLQTALAGQSVQITEAYPPTAGLRDNDGCHGDGTCADINFINRSTSVNDVKNLYSSLVSVGLHPSYEVTDQRDCPPYTAAGVPCASYDSTTGSHFHVNL